MELSDSEIRGYIKRLLLSRMRVLSSNGFYGLLLMHMSFAIDEQCSTAATDGTKIYFGPSFLNDLSEPELDFVMMHEILHVVLQHCLRTGDRDPEAFNIACDIVVNSNILLSNGMKMSSITLSKYGEAMHLAPDGKEGHNYTAEQVYEMLKGDNKTSLKQGKSDKKGNMGVGNNGTVPNKQREGKARATARTAKEGTGISWDDHSKWGSEDEKTRELWNKRLADACEAIAMREAVLSRSIMPAFARRMYDALRKPQTDWRSVLNDFVQEEINDYTFLPPDRRFDGPFFLPDFGDKDEMVEDILFMIDTSASMSDSMLGAAFSEVKGAIDSFDGKLKGWLGFFDAAVVAPTPFENEDEFKVIKPIGGGGTSFSVIFDYVAKNFTDKPPASIIILTDGYAPFPPPEATNGVPVLWLINNEKVTPPWGKIARIKL